MEYFLISEDTLKFYKPEKHSLPVFREGGFFFVAENTYVCLMDFKDFSSLYDEIPKEQLNTSSIWCQEITDAVVEINSDELVDIISQGLYEYLKAQYGATTCRNVAALIGAISKATNRNPIELFNYLNLML